MKLREFGIALFGEHYSANQFAKILVNKDGSPIDRKSVQNWINRDQDLNEDIVNQLKSEVKKRSEIIQKLIDNY